MLNRKKNLDNTGHTLVEPPVRADDGLEEELDSFTRAAVTRIRFNTIIKPAIISAIALVISFFIDVANVPILGEVTFDLARSLFPGWQAPIEAFEPYSFWWLPVAVYALFIFVAYLAYNKLKLEIIRTPASETIDRIIESSTSVVDSISTALPLIGAAILLVSIKLGEEVFLGLSVPFEIKALIILAMGKLFQPVLDQLGVDFQNVVNHVKDIRDKYFSRIQIESSKSLIKQFNQSGVGGAAVTVQDLEKYKSLVTESARLSEIMHKNFASVSSMVEKVNSMQLITTEKIQQLNTLANSITQASSSLTDEKTLIGLKHLEAIVKK
ncbi:MAG: hypothetical protein HND39_03100 [Ignavibacteriota bacterium]|nr:MAG: hypothetical protein EDM72_10515 [Chlorobiota bacterium]MBE7475247.1 hypothetical protein [Ignavibacteriales bacterium]MBL1122213.1 hypothetical protein [Ignavibacteriota bacterium]MCE7857640.1 hypothetical protein [Ignavibacteria bacterium CHB3]GJQ40508.1 MAG: hypothetical protein JETCAE03_00060 [Ignavibacteriaceae bacterium]